MTAENAELRLRQEQLEEEASFLTELLQQAVANSSNPLAAALTIPRKYLRDDMLPGDITVDHYCARREELLEHLAAIDAAADARVGAMEAELEALARAAEQRRREK